MDAKKGYRFKSFSHNSIEAFGLLAGFFLLLVGLLNFVEQLEVQKLFQVIWVILMLCVPVWMLRLCGVDLCFSVFSSH